MRSTEQLDALVREAWATGEHGDAHLRIHPDTVEALKAWRRPRPVPAWRQEHALANLTAIPIVDDDSVPVGMWRLVENADGHTRRTGRVFTDGGQDEVIPDA